MKVIGARWASGDHGPGSGTVPQARWHWKRNRSAATKRRAGPGAGPESCSGEA